MGMLIPGVSFSHRRGTTLVVLLALWRKLGVVKVKVAARHHRVLRDALSRLLVGRPSKIHANITRSRDAGGLDGSQDIFNKGRQYIRIGYLVERKHA